MLLSGEDVYFDHKISDCIMTMVPPLTAVNEIKFYSPHFASQLFHH